MQKSFTEIVLAHYRARCQLVGISSFEESRVIEALQEAVDEYNQGIRERYPDDPSQLTSVVLWDQIRGFSTQIGVPPKSPDPGRPLGNALTRLEEFDPSLLPKKCIVVMVDLPTIMKDDVSVRRKLRNIATNQSISNDSFYRMVVMVHPPGTSIHPDVEIYVRHIEFALPTYEQLDCLLETRVMNPSFKASCTPSVRHKLLQSTQGLTSVEAVECWSLCAAMHKSLGPEAIETAQKMKAAAISRSQTLTYISPDKIPSLLDLGGFKTMIETVQRWSLAYSTEAEHINLGYPKGMLIYGVPGTGKSVAGQAVAKALNLPLVVFDFGAVFDKFVGGSEEKMRQTIDTVTAINGCVLLVDEADKSLANAHRGGDSSGSTTRVFSAFLSWLSSKQDRTFVILTLNRTENLPPELLRKGRFDEIWYVDLPSLSERQQIFDIHLRKRGIDPSEYGKDGLHQLASMSEEFVGAEIESAITSSRFAAFELAVVRELIEALGSGIEVKEVSEKLKSYSPSIQAAALDLTPEQLAKCKRGIPSLADIRAAINFIAPSRTAQIDKESINAIRDFGKLHARRVAPLTSSASTTSKKRNVE